MKYLRYEITLTRYEIKFAFHVRKHISYSARNISYNAVVFHSPLGEFHCKSPKHASGFC